MTLHYSRPFTGGTLKVQDVPVEDISSLRRNPVLADVMAQLDYMEKRGSGLKKICNATRELETYKEGRDPVFRSSVSQLSNARLPSRLDRIQASLFGARCSVSL